MNPKEKEKVMRKKRSMAILYSETPHWVYVEGMDEEMKRQLEIKDRPKAR